MSKGIDKGFLDYIASGFVDPKTGEAADGAWAMWLILVIGGIIAALTIERIIYLYGVAGGTNSFMASISRFLKKGEFDKAIKFSKQKKYAKKPIAKAIVPILENRDKGTKVVQKSVDEVFLTETPKVTKFISLLNVFANISTMIGLMGTIYGLMLSFDAVANAPAAKRSTALADGIAVAMSTTLFGLVVGVSGIVIQGFLAQRSKKVVEDLDEKTAKLINLIEQ
ncbi:MAG: MotA/TolQ/ExbB proton channel family protein [Fibrobacterota bacterium]